MESCSVVVESCSVVVESCTVGVVVDGCLHLKSLGEDVMEGSVTVKRVALCMKL